MPGCAARTSCPVKGCVVQYTERMAWLMTIGCRRIELARSPFLVFPTTVSLCCRGVFGVLGVCDFFLPQQAPFFFFFFFVFFSFFFLITVFSPSLASSSFSSASLKSGDAVSHCLSITHASRTVSRRSTKSSERRTRVSIVLPIFALSTLLRLPLPSNTSSISAR